MKKIEYVLSKEMYGCAVACLAMVARTSYFEMREKLSNVFMRHIKKVTTLADLQLYADEEYDILRTHLGIRCRGVQFVSTIKNHCILFITPIDLGRNGHNIIWDAQQRKFLDPDNKVTDLDGFNVYYCIEILPPKVGLEAEQRGEQKYWRFNGVGPRVRWATNNKIEYIIEDLLLSQSDMTRLSREQRMFRLTKAVGLSETQIKEQLKQL